MTAPASAPTLAHLAAARPIQAAAPSRASLRALGVVAMLCAPSSLALWTPPAKTDLRANLFMTAYLLGWACSTIAMRRLRATGRGRGAAAFFLVQIGLLTLAACQQPQDQLGIHPLGDAFYFASDMAWPLSHVLMLGSFAAVWRARVWDGWRRWTPLACGLALPLTFAVAASGLATPNAVFCVGTASAFLALGLAVLTSRPEMRRA